MQAYLRIDATSLLSFSNYLGYLGSLAFLRLGLGLVKKIKINRKRWLAQVNFCANHVPLAFCSFLFFLLSLCIAVFVSILYLPFSFCCCHILTFLLIIASYRYISAVFTSNPLNGIFTSFIALYYALFCCIIYQQLGSYLGRIYLLYM